MSVYLSSIRSHCGDPRSIEALDLDPQEREAAEMMSLLGIENIRVSGHAPAELARRTLAEPLRDKNCQALVVAGSTWGDAMPGQVAAICRDLGRPQLVPFLVNGAECGNLGLALQVASGLVRSGLGNVALATSDACPPGRSRLVPPSISFLSDGAASCLLGGTPTPGALELVGIETGTEHEIRIVDNAKQFVRTMSLTATGVRRTVEELRRRTGFDPDRCHRVFSNNYSTSAMRVFANQMGIGLERFHRDSVSELGHVYAADPLIGMQEWFGSAATVESGSDFALLSTGMSTWSIAHLKFVR